MKKIFCMMCLALLVGCIFDNDESASSRKKMWWSGNFSGVAQHGFFIKTEDAKISMGVRYPTDDWIDSEPIPDSSESYSIKGTVRGQIAELRVGSDRYVSPRHSLVNNMDLSVVVDLDNADSVVNMNYLTSMASELIWHYIEQGISFEDARLRANTAILELFHMPKDLTDFEHYSLYGTGEGDAMLAAVSVVIELFYLDRSMSTEWIPLDIDVETGKFERSGVIPALVNYADGLLFGSYSFVESRYGCDLDSIHDIMKANSPDGSVPHIEKFLSILFGLKDGNEACTALNDGKMKDYEYDYRRTTFICKDSTWRMVTRDDFDESQIFNPDVEYGTLVDSRDGQSYKTVELNGLTWMAENLNYSDSVASENLKGQSWCYDNDEKNCAIFGRLYSWSAAMDLPAVYLDSVALGTGGLYRGICPEGWHMPTPEDFYKLYSEDTTFFSAYMSTMKNESGFSLIRAGYADREYSYDDEGNYVYADSVVFKEMGREACMWTNDQSSASGSRIYEIRLQMESSYCSLCNEPGDKHSGAYVRCVMDYEWPTY